ncbi:ImmA/IrrE family metallo-endopeptidase [Bifidobacterium aerophilum]|uniref:ImmA/IrrE family metallo-endopeptidase n=2 Tax=Bifidobacterium aerophilum TaxID=1798155 RepID=A0A6N9Z511_9BIFI|nr:ImmA/IrrE family metallo-endopeptidase [Bifidobacterium aerophilum]
MEVSAIRLPVDPFQSYGRMRMALYETAPGLTVMSDLLPDKMDGVYCLETDTILIDRRIDLTKKRCTLVHELVHRWYGDDGDGHYTAKQEMRCRLETARLMVRVDDYADAERMYDGDAFLIAAELDRTVQVIRDFQRLLRDGVACRGLPDLP